MNKYITILVSINLLITSFPCSSAGKSNLAAPGLTMSGINIRDKLKSKFKGTLSSIIDKEVGIDRLFKVLEKIKKPDDDRLIRNVLVLLQDTGIYDDENEIKDLVQQVLLIDVKGEDMSRKSEEIDGVIIRDNMDLKIIFSRNKLQYIIQQGADKSSHILGDLLYQIMKYKLLTSGMKVSEAHYHAERLRDAWNDTEEGVENAKAVINDAMNPHRLGKLEHSFEEIVTDIVKELKEAKKDKILFADIRARFPHVLEERGWYEPDEVKERFIRMLGFLNKTNRDAYRKDFKTNRFGIKELILSIQRLHTVATSMDKFRLQDEGLVELTLPKLLKMVVLSHAQHFLIMEKMKKDLFRWPQEYQFKIDTWEDIEPEPSIRFELGAGQFKDVLDECTPAPSVDIMKAICEHFKINIEDFENHVVLVKSSKLQEDNGFIELWGDAQIQNLLDALYRNINEGILKILISGQYMQETSDFTIDRFIARGSDGIVLKLTDSSGFPAILKINNSRTAAVIGQIRKSMKRFVEATRSDDHIMDNIAIYTISSEYELYGIFFEESMLLEVGEFVHGPTLEDVINRPDFWGTAVEDYLIFANQLMGITDTMNQRQFVNEDQRNLSNVIVNLNDGNCKFFDFRYINFHADVGEDKAKQAFQRNRRRLILSVMRLIFGQRLNEVKPEYKEMFIRMFINRFGKEYIQRAGRIFNILLMAWQQDKSISWVQRQMSNSRVCGEIPLKRSLPSTIFNGEEVIHVRVERKGMEHAVQRAEPQQTAGSAIMEILTVSQ